MDITTLLIAVALAMDSFSVAIANGLATKKIKNAKAIKIAAFFGFFQAIMPIIGWYAGAHILDLISEVDHWIAFILSSSYWFQNDLRVHQKGIKQHHQLTQHQSITDIIYRHQH